MAELRRELLRFETADGGLDLVDLLLEQVHHFDAAEARALAGLETESAPAALTKRLESALLLEGETAEELRRSGWAARMRPTPVAPELGEAEGPWELAAKLPAFVAPEWREPERWRRLAEDRVAGRLLLRAEGFMARDAARDARDRFDAAEFQRQDSMYARAECLQGGEEACPELVAAFREGPLHTLLSHAMGEALPARMFTRCWRLGPGDRMAVHADGLHYVTTFSLGLSEAWTAAAGGAIAFGTPGPGGIEVTERWLPHLGDLLLFRPSALLWHAVEPVAKGKRMTFTGHYVGASYPG